MLFYGLCWLFVVIIHNLIYIYIYICFLYVLSTVIFQTFSGSFSRHRSLKEISIWLTDLQVSVSVQTGTFQKIANNIYIMEMPILGLMIPKKNAAVCSGMTIVLYEMEGCNMAPKFKGFLPRFPRWAVYEMMLVFPFHTGHGFFHSIQVQSRGVIKPYKTNFILANRPGIRMKPSLVPSHSLPSSALLTALQPTHPRPQGWSYAGDLRRWSAWLSTVHASDAKCCPRTSETAWSMLSRRWSNIFDSPLYIPVLTLGSAKNRYYATHHSHMRLYI